MLPAAACTTTPSPGRRRTRPHPSRPRRLQPQASAHTSITAGYRKLSRTRPQSQSSPCSRNLETSALPASRRRQVGYLIGRRLAGHRLESTHHSVAGSRPRPASRHLPRPRDQGFSRFPYCYSVPRFAQGKGESGAARRTWISRVAANPLRCSRPRSSPRRASAAPRPRRPPLPPPRVGASSLSPRSGISPCCCEGLRPRHSSPLQSPRPRLSASSLLSGGPCLLPILFLSPASSYFLCSVCFQVGTGSYGSLTVFPLLLALLRLRCLCNLAQLAVLCSAASCLCCCATWLCSVL